MSSPIVGGFHLLYSTLLRLLTMLERKYSKLATFPSLYQLFSHFRQFWFFLLRSTYQKKNILPFSRTSCCWGLLINVMKVIIEISLHSFIYSQTVLSLGNLFQSFDLIALECFLLIKGWVLPQACFCWRGNLKFYQLVFYKFLKAGFDNWRTSRTYVRLLSLVYAWLRTCVSWHVRSFFPYDISKFSRFFWLFFSGSGSLKT